MDTVSVRKLPAETARDQHRADCYRSADTARNQTRLLDTASDCKRTAETARVQQRLLETKGDTARDKERTKRE